MKTLHKRILSVIAVAFMAVLTVFISAMQPQATVFAAGTNEVKFDSTYVMDDLKNSTISGKKFALEDYAFDESKSLTVLYLSEYCYSFYSLRQGNYGLYLYVWNPQGLDFIANSTLNSVELSYGDKDTNGYGKYRLTCLSVSHETNYERLFYKFKVDLKPAEKAEILRSLKSDNRYYHIAGMELLLPDEVNPHDYPVNKEFFYSGFAKGYGANADADTLVYTSRFGEVLDIERQGGLRQTFYRPKGSNGVNGYTQDTLQTVYFSVPNKYFDNDFAIGSIRMEWLKTLTQWGLVTGNQALYASLKEWVGVCAGGRYEKNKNDIYKNGKGQPFPTEYGFSASYSGKGVVSFNSGGQHDLSYLPYLFPSNSWKTNSADDYVLPYETMLEYMQTYGNTYDKSRIFYDASYEPPHVLGQTVAKGSNVIFETPFGGEKVNVDGVEYNYSRALFSWVAQHKTKLDISAKDERTLKSVVIGRKWWDGLFGLDGSYEVSSTTFDGIEAIHCVEPKDIKSSSTLTCDELYIDYADYNDFKKFYDEATKQQETVVLVRYDVSTYQAVEGAQGIKHNGTLVTGWDNGDTNCRAFRMNYYLGLDVIHIAFDNGVERFILPVISSPIDAASDGTPALETHNDAQWWYYVVAFLFFVLVVIIAYKLIKGVLLLIFKR